VIPPPYISKLALEVTCHGPEEAPDGQHVLFVKDVVQSRTRKEYVVVVFGGSWMTFYRPVWSKSFLCRSDVDGGDKKCLFEIDGGIPPVCGMEVSKDANKVVLASYSKVSVYDLSGGPQRETTYKIPNPQPVWLSLAPNGKEFALISGDRGEPLSAGGIAVCDLQGHVRIEQFMPSVQRLTWSKKKNLIVAMCGDVGHSYYCVIDPQTMQIISKVDPGSSQQRGEYYDDIMRLFFFGKASPKTTRWVGRRVSPSEAVAIWCD
jgi:hypothetical protein